MKNLIAKLRAFHNSPRRAPYGRIARQLAALPLYVLGQGIVVIAVALGWGLDEACRVMESAKLR